MATSDDDLKRQCHEVIDRLLAQHSWALLDREEFRDRMLAAAQAHPSVELAYIAFGVYNQALYDACSGREGPLRWEQGYRELHEMLCRRARLRYPDVWEDAVQSALVLTCEGFKRCAVPQAFFQFAWGHLQNAVRGMRPHRRRKDKRQDISLEAARGGDDQPLLASLPDSHTDILEQILANERSSEIRAALARIEAEHPRARKQLAAMILKYLDDEDEEALSQLLGVSVKRLHELRALGKKKLQADQLLRQLLVN